MLTPACPLWQAENQWHPNSSSLLSSLKFLTWFCATWKSLAHEAWLPSSILNTVMARAEPRTHWVWKGCALFPWCCVGHLIIFLVNISGCFSEWQQVTPSLSVWLLVTGWWRVLFLQRGDLPSQFGGTPWVLVKRRISAFMLTHLPTMLASQLFLTCVTSASSASSVGFLSSASHCLSVSVLQGLSVPFIGTFLGGSSSSHSSISNSDHFVGISTWVSQRNLSAACPRRNYLSCLSLFRVIVLYWLGAFPTTLSPKVEIWEPFSIPACISLPVSYQCPGPWNGTPLSCLTSPPSPFWCYSRLLYYTIWQPYCRAPGISPRLS